MIQSALQKLCLLGFKKMNEKEKMLKGLLYDANYDKALIEERKQCMLF